MAPIQGLAALLPRGSEYFGDVEPTAEQPGNLQNAHLTVRCVKDGTAFPQGAATIVNGIATPVAIYYNVNAEIILWMEVDEQTQKEGIDSLFHWIELTFDNAALHYAINAAAQGLFRCEGTRQRKSARSEQTGRYVRGYAVQCICIDLS